MKHNIQKLPLCQLCAKSQAGLLILLSPLLAHSEQFLTSGRCRSGLCSSLRSHVGSGGGGAEGGQRQKPHLPEREVSIDEV